MTEKEKVELRREGFVARCAEGFVSTANCEAEAKRRFPAPVETKPREVTFHNGIHYRILDGAVEYRLESGQFWQRSTQLTLDAAATKMLADLLANPTVTVECDC